MKENRKKETEKASFFQELGSFMKPYRGKYSLSVLISILGVVSGLMAYAFAGMIAGMVFSAEFVWTNVLWTAVFAVLCKLLKAVCVNYSTWMSHQAAYLTLKDIRLAVARKWMKLPLGYFDKNGTGRLKSMLVDHIEGMEKTLAHMIPEMTANLLGPLCLIVWMFFLDWRLALVMLLWIMIGFSVTGGMMKGYEQKYAGQIAAHKAMNQSVVEYVSGIEVIKNFGRSDECYQKYKDAVEGHAEYNINWMKETQIYSSLGMAIAPFSVFPVLIAGLIFYANHTLEPAVLVMMVLLSFSVFGPLMQSSMYFDQAAQMGTDAREIKNVLSYPELERGNETTLKQADVTFDNVTFSYEKDAGPAIENISFQVPKGTMLALVGPSGSGKSTIAKLLAGYWDTADGQILLGGKRLKDYSQEALNNFIAYVDQETFLFDETVMENIRMGRPDATDEEVMKAAREAGCDEFISALPNGYQTTAGTAGSRLSGGEKQRIAIARAMMKNAPIMILDEATSSSDPENEAAIQSALSAAAKGKTLIVVAHRLKTIVHAEQIAFVKDGHIQTIGSHEMLLEKCPEYQQMWNLSKEEKAC